VPLWELISPLAAAVDEALARYIAEAAWNERAAAADPLQWVAAEVRKEASIHGGDAVQEASTGLLASQALIGPGAEALRGHNDVTAVLWDGVSSTEASRQSAAQALSQLDSEDGADRVHR
jgi:hypothetical protein